MNDEQTWLKKGVRKRSVQKQVGVKKKSDAKKQRPGIIICKKENIKLQESLRINLLPHPPVRNYILGLTISRCSKSNNAMINFFLKRYKSLLMYVKWKSISCIF